MRLFRDLDEDEVEVFKQWARDNYKVHDPIKGVWHLVVQAECVQMNIEWDKEQEDESQD